jgi:hypothetical protein
VFLAMTWAEGSRTWPPGEIRPERKLGTAAETIEAALSKRGPSAGIRIGVIGDIQNGISELAELLDAMRNEHVDFILQLGDAANVGLPGRYAVLRREFEQHAPGIPVIAVPGNHDIEPDGTTAVWSEWVGPPVWRIDARGWRILGIDDASGTISAESMDVLRRAAADPKPSFGTLVVAHRPLGARETKEGIDARAKQIASTGLVPTYTISGHWHMNDQSTDAAGTIHFLLGENCDRASSGDDPLVSVAVLSLLGGKPPGTGPGYDLSIGGFKRSLRLGDEFLRTAVGSTYPSLRTSPRATWCGILLLFAAGIGLAVVALRRAPAPKP